VITGDARCFLWHVQYFVFSIWVRLAAAHGALESLICCSCFRGRFGLFSLPLTRNLRCRLAWREVVRYTQRASCFAYLYTSYKRCVSAVHTAGGLRAALTYAFCRDGVALLTGIWLRCTGYLSAIVGLDKTPAGRAPHRHSTAPYSAAVSGAKGPVCGRTVPD